VKGRGFESHQGVKNILTMIIKVPNISDKLKDNRKMEMKGLLSNPADIQEAYRELCAEYGLSLSKMYSFTKSNIKIDERGLLMLCKRLDCIFIIDNYLDFFFIKYAPKGVSTVDVSEFEKKKPGGADNFKKTPEEPETKQAERFEKVEGTGVQDPATETTEIIEDDEEELF
jgi:hypothetical protein